MKLKKIVLITVLVIINFYIFSDVKKDLLSFFYNDQADKIVDRVPQNTIDGKLDQRLSISHISGIYPQINDGTYLEYGANDALSLGFQNIEIYIHPSVCLPRPSLPQGIYRNISDNPGLSWCENIDYGNSAIDYQLKPEYKSLVSLVSQNVQYRNVLDKPFRNFFLTVDPINYQRAAYSIVTGGVAYTQAQYEAQYEEMYNLTTYLLRRYQSTGKNFILQTSNEADWPLLNAKSKNLKTVIQNTINLWNNAQNAINDAHRDSFVSGVKVYQGCEFNKVVSGFSGKKNTIVNSVLPHTYCDLYAYSAYDSILPSSQYNSKNLIKALNYIAKKTKPSRDFGRKNIYISEIGLREDIYPVGKKNKYSKMINGDLLVSKINEALAWGVPFINLWTLYDNECRVPNPTSDSECPGYFMRKPSGQLSETYHKIRERFYK